MDDTLNVNMAALLNIRSLPRGIDVKNRIQAIQNLLTPAEVYESFRFLRHKIFCPKCSSNKIKTILPPLEMGDTEKCFYQCEACNHIFDDLSGTGFEGVTYQELRNFILSWYLSSFCPMSLISELTGFSLDELANYLHRSKEMERLIEGGLKAALEAHLRKRKNKTVVDTKQEELEHEQRQLRRLMFGIKPKL